jgi:hypothetical protein
VGRTEAGIEFGRGRDKGNNSEIIGGKDRGREREKEDRGKDRGRDREKVSGGIEGRIEGKEGGREEEIGRKTRRIDGEREGRINPNPCSWGVHDFRNFEEVYLCNGLSSEF